MNYQATIRAMETANETLGERLARLRNAKGWTQGQLAQRAKVGQSTVAGIESNARATIPGSLIDIAHALGEDAYYLKHGVRKLIGGDKTIDRVVSLMLDMSAEGRAVVLDKALDMAEQYKRPQQTGT